MHINSCSDQLRVLIRQARLAKGLSQEQLGELTMMDRNKISAIETGKKANLVWEDLAKIADALEIPENEIAHVLSGTSGEGQHAEVMNFLRKIYNILLEILDQLTED